LAGKGISTQNPTVHKKLVSELPRNKKRSDMSNNNDMMKASHDQMQARINEIAQLAMRLNVLMDPGMSVTIVIPEKKSIIVPNQPPSVHQIIITKPVLSLGIQVNPEK
jgi:hypothetical protein